MISSYLKVVLRNLFKSPVFSAINITGLALGLSCSIFIALWISDELKVDSFHENDAQLYRVLENQEYPDGTISTTNSTPGLLARTLKDEIPEVEMACAFTWSLKILVAAGDDSRKMAAKYVEPDFLKMLSYPLIKGDPSMALSDPNSMVISEKMAKQYFGNEDPLGKVMRVDNERDVHVTGVFRDAPTTSSLPLIS